MFGRIRHVVFALILVVVVAILGYILWHSYHNTPVTPKSVPKATTETTAQVTSKNTTTFQYVPKTSPTDSDVEFVSNTASNSEPIRVTVNGVQQEIPKSTVTESQKFEKGKLVVTEDRQVNIDLKIPEQPKLKKGIYVEQDVVPKKDTAVGVRVSYQTQKVDVDLKADLWRQKEDKRVTATVTRWF